jgi:SP family sugar:H+ symporter-like MFS transporter
MHQYAPLLALARIRRAVAILIADRVRVLAGLGPVFTAEYRMGHSPVRKDVVGSEHNLFIVLISVIATIGGFLFGFDSGVVNGTVDGLQSSFQSDSVGTGFNVASMLLGCAAGAFFAGHLADIYGRKRLLQLAATLFLISAWGSGVAGQSLTFIIFRILGGAAVGAASVLAPAYISEVTPARYRGAMTSIQQVAIISGLFLAFVSNYTLANYAGSSQAEWWWGFEAWRWMFWMELIPAAVFFLALLRIPESPRYLVLNRELDEAGWVLGRLFGDDSVAEKLAEIEATVAVDHHRPRLSDLINSETGRVRRVVWVGIGLASLQQLVGINVVFYYGAVLWQAVGFSESDALLINIISGAVSIAACIVTILAIDRVGRKPLLLLGSIGMTVALAVLTTVFSNAESGVGGSLVLSEGQGWAALIAANGYVFMFNMTWGPVMWVMLGEMFPNQLRGSGLAISGLVQWLTNFAITMTFPLLLAGVGLIGAYGFYTFAALASIVFVVLMVHETRGLELEDMPA